MCFNFEILSDLLTKFNEVSLHMVGICRYCYFIQSAVRTQVKQIKISYNLSETIKSLIAYIIHSKSILTNCNHTDFDILRFK